VIGQGASSGGGEGKERDRRVDRGDNPREPGGLTNYPQLRKKVRSFEGWEGGSKRWEESSHGPRDPTKKRKTRSCKGVEGKELGGEKRK